MKIAFNARIGLNLLSRKLFSYKYNETLSKFNCQNRLVSKVVKPNMVRVLNVAEKNDAAKSLAEIMSRGGARRVWS